MDQNDRPLAGRIIHEHKGYATDVLAANSDLSRNNGATFFMMHSIFALLRSENKISFDFGRIPPSDHASDSVYQFKKSAGGSVLQYNGEWTSYSNTRTELLMFIYKLLKLKKQRY